MCARSVGGRLTGVALLGAVGATAVGAAVVHALVAPELSGSALVQVRAVLAGTVGVVTVAVGLVAYRVRSRSRAVATLRSASEALRAGEDPGPLPTDRGDDVGETARALSGVETELDRLRSTAAETELTAAAARRLRDRAEAFADTMAVCAAGDMTARLDTDAEEAEMRELAAAYNRVMDEVEGLLAETRVFAAEVTERSREVQVATTEIRNASRNVSQSVQRIADGADEQDDRMAAVSESIQDLSATAEDASTISTDLAEVAGETATRGLDGREQAQAALAGIIQIREATETTVEAIERITDRTGEVNELVGVVDEIATRTNKLALNANIEATKTGEGDSEGFEVIAEEIEQLAGDARGELTEVEDRIERIENDTRNATRDVRDAVDRMSRHSEAIDETIAALDEVASMASDTNKEVKAIRDITSEQAELVREVATEVREVNGISTETSEAADRAAAAAQEQTAAADGIVDLTGDLVGEAASLESRLAEFNLTSDAPDPRIGQVDTSEIGASHDVVGLEPVAGEGAGPSEDEVEDADDGLDIPEAAMGDLFGFSGDRSDRADDVDDLVYVDGSLAADQVEMTDGAGAHLDGVDDPDSGTHPDDGPEPVGDPDTGAHPDDGPETVDDPGASASPDDGPDHERAAED